MQSDGILFTLFNLDFVHKYVQKTSETVHGILKRLFHR